MPLAVSAERTGETKITFNDSLVHVSPPVGVAGTCVPPTAC